MLLGRGPSPLLVQAVDQFKAGAATFQCTLLSWVTSDCAGEFRFELGALSWTCRVRITAPNPEFTTSTDLPIVERVLARVDETLLRKHIIITTSVVLDEYLDDEEFLDCVCRVHALPRAAINNDVALLVEIDLAQEDRALLDEAVQEDSWWERFGDAIQSAIHTELDDTFWKLVGEHSRP